MTPRDDDSQSKRPANASDASGAGDDLRPASRDEVRAANALDERAGRTRWLNASSVRARGDDPHPARYTAARQAALP